MIERAEYCQMHVGRDGLMLLHQYDHGVSDCVRDDGPGLVWDCHVLRHLIQSNTNVVVDGSGYPGVYTLFLAQHLTKGLLMTFEPQRSLFQLLCGTMALNSYQQVQCVNSVLGASNQTVYYPQIEVSAFDSTTKVDYRSVLPSLAPLHALDYPVQQVALDSYALGRLDVLILGRATLGMLHGAEQTLQAHHPALFWEAPWVPSDRDALQHWLIAANYEVYSVCNADGLERYVALWRQSPVYLHLPARIRLETHLMLPPVSV